MAVETRLFVGNIPENINESELQSAFSTYGEITGFDLKTKPGAEKDAKKFAFITLAASHYNIESCIQHFSSEVFEGQNLYVTRARESFLERLQRERQQAKLKESAKNEVPILPKKNPVIKLDENLNPRKRKSDNQTNGFKPTVPMVNQLERSPKIPVPPKNCKANEWTSKEQDSDKKRLESMKKKRQEFKQKQMIIKSNLIAIDKIPNKKVVFSDSDEEITNDKKLFVNGSGESKKQEKQTLFDEEDSDSEVNFEIKEQFEGKKGQKVLELQSRFKSDKRFVLDERFIEEDQLEAENEQFEQLDDAIHVGQTDEKSKQMTILQDVLGIAIKPHDSEHDVNREKRKLKTNLGMLRFDPMQPNHSKYLATIEVNKQEPAKKVKNKKIKETQPDLPPPNVQTVEASKEQFYKVSETLKEAIAQPNSFSLRSLFNRDENDDTNKIDLPEDDASYIPLEKPKASKVKNPFNPDEKNPFKYDSSDSEEEVADKSMKKETVEEKNEVKPVWNEKLFFSKSDPRLLEGLEFFSKAGGNKGQKERRDMKSVMKKRLHNKDRKDQMFKKKIGGKRKGGQKKFRNKKAFSR